MVYDVIIIGSGLGGLETALLLSRAGLSVLVLERQVQPGGCMQSYRRGAFTHDTGLHYVGGLAEGQPLHDAFQRLGLLQLPWHRLDADGFDRVTIGDRTYCFAEGYDRFSDVMAGYFPDRREALRQYVGVLRQTVTSTVDTTHLMDVSAYRWLTDTFRDPLLVDVLSGAAMKTELCRESLPLFTFAHQQSSYIQSSWRLRGDGNLLVRCLTDQLTASGGQLLCRAEVTDILVDGGLVSGVRLADGRQYQCRRLVSDVHPLHTFRMVRPEGTLRPLFLRRLSMLHDTVGFFTLSLVLRAGALPYFNHNKYVYPDPCVWSLAERATPTSVGGVMVSCRVPLAVGDPYTRQVDLITPVPWSLWQPWEHTLVGRRGAGYVALKQQLSEACLRLAERAVPGLSAMVVERHASSPLTYRDYTLTPCGSGFGLRKDCRQPVLTMLSPRTPIPNLLLTGQSLMLHGVEGVTMTALRTVDSLLQ